MIFSNFKGFLFILWVIDLIDPSSNCSPERDLRTGYEAVFVGVQGKEVIPEIETKAKNGGPNFVACSPDVP